MTGATFLCAGGCGKSCRDFPKRKTRFCVDCSRKANGRHPDKIRLSREAMKRRMADPVLKAAHLGRAHEGFRQRIAQDPDFAARMSASGRHMGLSKAGHAAQPRGSEPRQRAAASRMKTILGWCPADYRAEYDHLVNSKRLKAAQAREVIERKIAADLKKMSPHERNLRQIALGARLVPAFKPSRCSPDFTLGGVGSSML